MSLRIVIEHAVHPQPVREMRLEAGDMSIGRGADCDWQIEDPDMFISRRHCILSGRNGRWTVTDASRGGLFIDGADAPLGAGNSAEIGHGTRLRMGDVVLRIELEEAAAPPRRPAAAPAATPFGADDFFSRAAEPPPPPPVRPRNLPEPFDAVGPAAPPPVETGWQAPRTAPDDPFLFDVSEPARPPVSRPLPPAQSTRPAAGGDDFRFDDFFAAPSGQAPVTDPEGVGPEATGRPGMPHEHRGQPWPDPEPVRAGEEPPRASGRGMADAPEPAAAPVAQAPRAEVRAASVTGPDDRVLWEAFFRGLGLSPPEAASPEEMEALGRRFRLLTEGLVQLLRSRAREKSSVRVAQTVIGHSDVNPLKFLATTDETVEALVRHRGKGYPAPDDAINAAFRDLSDHQIRTWTALQAALRRMIDRFDPGAFEAEADKAGKMKALIQGGRSARLWQLYVDRYRDIAKAAEDRFLGEIGADFREAYEGKGRTKDD